MHARLVARSGDKGANRNVGSWAPDPGPWPWLLLIPAELVTKREYDDVVD